MDGENPAETRPAGARSETPPVTGNEKVDATLSELSVIGELPVEEHPGLLDRTNSRLGEILGEVESGDDPSPA
jgi:hypothetical protein